jgi:quercetin dioxygenase-like cupin family protein
MSRAGRRGTLDQPVAAAPLAWYDDGDVAAQGAAMSDAIVVREEERPVVPFPGGATYRTLIGDDNGGGVPLRTGIQTSQPGYATREHSHPYVEILTVLSGRGEAWLTGEEGTVAMAPGVTIAIPAGRVHGFRVLGEAPLVTLGIHASPQRIVDYR